MPVLQAWAPLTWSPSGGEGRWGRVWMGWSGWWRVGQEARGCEDGVGCPGLSAGLRSVASHCPSWWAQTSTDHCLPSVHLLEAEQKQEKKPQ